MNPALLRAALSDPNAARDAVEKELCERSLEEFVRRAWPSVVPQAYQHNWHVTAIARHLEAVANGEIRRLLINIPPRFAKTLLCSVMFPVWVWLQNKDPDRPLVGPGATFLCISYGDSKSQEDAVTARRLISSEWFQKHWGGKVVIAKDRDNQERVDTVDGGSRISVGVQSSVLGRGGNIKIIDDASKPDEAESPVSRAAVLRAYDETLSSRENDPRIAAEIIIAQRLHENDLPGHVLTKYGSDPDNGGFVHLCLPLAYDSQRHCQTSIGWQDPRGCDEDGEMLPDEERALRDGTSLWPGRFPTSVIEQRKKAEGSYSFCTPAESPILMSDLSMKPIGQVRVGDVVAGFDISTAENGKTSYRRRKLVRARVLDISRSVRPVVKITLDSGKTIRCTPDHRWYTKRSDSTHVPYRAAKVGSYLFRVCDDALPQTDTTEKTRAAGWLGGFFDGEGCVTVAKKSGSCDSRSKTLITFTQGCEKGLPICNKLESVLNTLGFDYEYDERSVEAREGSTATWQRRRTYYLRGRALPLAQKFLSLAQPNRWVDRIVEGAYGAQFIIGKERVVSIEDDGEETVYGLETETGNYVVWGFASSNSAKYQQIPVPRGGGIIKPEWWQDWPPEGEEFDEYGKPVKDVAYPYFEYIVASLDTALTTKQQNDPSALTVWGVFRQSNDIAELDRSVVNTRENSTGGRDLAAADYADGPKIMLITGWEKRLEFHDLLNTVITTCRKRRVDRLIIEAKTAGHSVAQELQRLLKGEQFSVMLQTPKGDKDSRLHSVSHLFEAGLVYAPNRAWAEKVKDQCSAGSMGAHDDLADTASAALRHLRNLGEALTIREHERDVLSDLSWSGDSEPLYDV